MSARGAGDDLPVTQHAIPKVQLIRGCLHATIRVEVLPQVALECRGALVAPSNRRPVHESDPGFGDPRIDRCDRPEPGLERRGSSPGELSSDIPLTRLTTIPTRLGPWLEWAYVARVAGDDLLRHFVIISKTRLMSEPT